MTILLSTRPRPNRLFGLMRTAPQAVFQRDPTLAGYGFALLATAIVLMVVAGFDGRSLNGETVWAKPIKFLLSVGLFALTSGWFIGDLPSDRQRAMPARIIRWTIIATGSLELAYITWQAALGQPSHFNATTPFHATMYALMGLGAVALTATALPLAREVWRHGVGLPPAMRLSIVLGLALTAILGIGTGIVLARHGGHAVGGIAGAPGLPFTGWSTTGGDLRIPHFLGIHAQQGIPLAGAASVTWLPRHAKAAVWVISALYVVLTLAAFVLALKGRSPFSP